jgi:hypothetical protein
MLTIQILSCNKEMLMGQSELLELGVSEKNGTLAISHTASLEENNISRCINSDGPRLSFGTSSVPQNGAVI